MSDPLDPTLIAFRPLREQDIPLVYRWRCLPHVRQWWRDEPYEAIAVKLTRRAHGDEPASSFLMLYGAAPIGYIHTYHVSDFPDYAARVGSDAENAAGVDLFIGDARYLHRGLGAPIIREFLRAVVFADSTVDSCLIGPDPTNMAAIRAYAKSGFRYLKTIPGERPDESEYLMRLARAESDDPHLAAGPDRP
ncbi:MAG TPA: GNAT family N-acetyltransferase [Ktedonobacterales bacterium]|nr:GNAT family N-acetyltransferase [Ktedonobacterales bacterium]